MLYILVQAEYVHYVSMNTVDTINTIILCCNPYTQILFFIVRRLWWTMPETGLLTIIRLKCFDI